MMMSEATVTDRPHQGPQLTSGATAASSSEIKRDPDVWLEDGNVVVIAQQIAFRFHRGTLSRHSEVFRSLFTVPQPTSPDMMDGCPVVHVTDTSYDFKLLLRAIYDGVSFFTTQDPMEFSVLAALVRMGHKYEVEPLLDESLRRLRTVYTTDFATWNKHQHEGSPLATLRRADAIEAINLFRLVGQSQMLPSAFYACARLFVSEILAGLQRVDGTLERLSAEDLAVVLEGRTELVKYDAQIAGLFYHPPPTASCTCPSVDGPRSLLAARLKSTIASFPTFLNASVFNPYLTDEAHTYIDSQQLCRNCGEALVAHHFSLMEALWNKLPSVFGIQAQVPGWGEDEA